MWPVILNVLALALAAVMAPKHQGSPLEKWVESEMRDRHIPGMAVGVFRYGKPVEILTRGYADLENRVPVKRQTQFEICSVTKQFTAVAVLLLVQDGKMALDDPISKYIAEIPPGWAGVTIRRLLDHTSGIPNPIFEEHLTSLPISEALGKLFAHPLMFSPGDQWLYNNTGYWLLGMAIERASGEHYFDFLSHHIFSPLKMKHTFPNRAHAIVPWRARGYSYEHGVFKNAPPLSDIEGNAAGGLISTLDDMNIWSQALYSGKILSPSSRAEMLRAGRLKSGDEAWPVVSDGYGLGVFVGKSGGHRYEKHSGGWYDASCQLIRFPDDGLTVVMLTNVGGYEQRSFSGESIAHLYIPKIQVPSWRATSQSEESKVTRVVSRFLRSSSASARTDLMTPSLAALSKTKNPEFDKFFSPLGALKKLQFVRRVRQGSNAIHVYKAQFDKAVICAFTLTKDLKVADIQYFEPMKS